MKIWAKSHKTRKEKRAGKFIFHPLFLCLAVHSFLCGNLYYFLLYSISIVAHELVHLWVAKRLGYRLDYFKLSVTGASMKLLEDEFFLNDEILVAISAPIFNLFVFVILSSGWWIFPVSYNFTVDLAYINLFIFLLNMMPIYSLDGGRIFLCMFEKRMGKRAAIKVVQSIGVIGSIVLCLIFVICAIAQVVNFSLGVMAIFLFLSSTSSGCGSFRSLSFKSKLDKLESCHGFLEECFVFSAGARLVDLYRKIKPEKYAVFRIIEKKTKRVITINEDQLLFLIESKGAGTTLCEAIFE